MSLASFKSLDLPLLEVVTGVVSTQTDALLEIPNLDLHVDVLQSEGQSGELGLALTNRGRLRIVCVNPGRQVINDVLLLPENLLNFYVLEGRGGLRRPERCTFHRCSRACGPRIWFERPGVD